MTTRLAVCGSMLLASFAAFPAAAQDDEPPEEDLSSEQLDRIRDERQDIADLQAAKARSIDATTAEVGELTQILDSLDASLNAQEIRLATAERSLLESTGRLERATEAVRLGEEAVANLSSQLRGRAIATFLNRDIDTPAIIQTDDPGLTARMEALVATVTQSDADLANDLRLAEDDLRIDRATAAQARVDAAVFRSDMATIRDQLVSDRIVQLELIQQTEDRLEFLLGEMQSLQSVDAVFATEEKEELEELAREWARRQAAVSSGLAGPIATPDDIEVVSGIAIHRSIAPNLQALIDAAAADNIILNGGGWRDASAQIRLRKAHCGSTDYDIWEKPASACRPPTARPGASLHERGLAVDFRHDGRGIVSRAQVAYIWLRDNAAAYGFYNLPSEPWHWSTTGR